MRIFILNVFILLFFENVSSVPRRVSFIKASMPERFWINVCFPTSNLPSFVTSRLETCGVTSPFRVIGMGECQGSCNMNATCVGFAYTKSNRMCTHCHASNLSGQGLSIPHDDVMIVVERLETYINGEPFKTYSCIILQQNCIKIAMTCHYWHKIQITLRQERATQRTLFCCFCHDDEYIPP